MASNSKKRRRVLGVSCILAALIIASSSFAWFTSKDEVTNRLSASADYNVSIIENFVPPKQWVPGETVTKEEAVVNTGNIDAFVKQQITGDLQITVEVPTAVVPTASSTGYVTLNEAEYGTLEAGSFLAWGPNADEIGRKIVYAMDKSEEGGHALPQTTDFKPTTDGLYIFRRAITTDNNMDDTQYEYVGYYYVNGTYYKLNRIVPASLVLDTTKNDGSLSEAPTVYYAKESTDTLKKVAMTYDDTDVDDVQLKLSYSTGTNPDLSAIANLSEEAYKKYRDYVDAVKGKTSWDADRVTTTEVGTYATTTYMKAKNTSNLTGLTNYDEFSTTGTVTPLDDLTNWSQERLADRATETQAELDAASPGGKFDGSNATENWTTVYDAAVADRATVNKGVRSAERLAVLKQKVVGLLGTNGLVQDAAYPFHYSSATYTVTGNTVNVVAPTVTLDNPTDTPLGNGDNGSDPRKLTLDNMYEAGFADDTGSGFGGDVSFSTTPDFGAQFDYANASGALKTAWDEYVRQTQRLTLVQAKIDLYTTTSTTDVARTDPEWQSHLAWLNDKKDEINEALATAKKAYEDEVKKIKADIDQMNLYQDDVNAANEVDTGKPNPFSVTATYVGDGNDATTYPAADKSAVQNNGLTETVTEQTLRTYLENVFGVAYKESGETTYTGTTDTNPVADTDAYKDIWTYSYELTKAKVDKNLSKVDDGKLDWDTTVTGTDAMSATDRNAATNKPYYTDRKVDTMKAYRDEDVAEKLRLYNVAKANADAITTGDENVGPIDIIVHLANIGDGNTADQWQYIADATGTNEYNFYYTGILESGETSSMLIKSVEMPGTVTQDMFRDLQFDLNVTSESAQVTYDGDIVRPTAANTTITGGKTTADGYAVTDAVKWEKDTTAKTAINDKDPQGKATANVT